MERMLVLIFVPLMVPVLLAIAVAIKLTTPGPVLFRQRRPGIGDSFFVIVKFRTMFDSSRGAGSCKTLPDDPRVTPLGRFLRRTHLDELPQVWNILRGEMTFIGPRPEPIPNNDEYVRHIKAFSVRRSVLPGITGLAQTQVGYTFDVTGAREKFKCYLYYIQNASVGLDARILVQTIRELLAPRKSW